MVTFFSSSTQSSCFRLTLYKLVGGWARGHASGGKWYWEDDIFDMVKRWGALQNDVHMRIIGARQSLEQFRRERIKLVADVHEVSSSFMMNVQIINDPFLPGGLACQGMFPVAQEYPLGVYDG